MPNRFAIDKKLIANDHRFHYRDWGGRGWPVLLLHGLGSTSHVWDLVAPLIVDEARVIALDLRGHGQSDKPDQDYTFEDIGADLRGVIETLEFERPLLVGHEWGASLALWMAARSGGEIGGVVCVDGGLIDLSRLSWEDAQQAFRAPRITGTPAEEFRAQVLEAMPQGIITPAVEAAIMASVEIDAENSVHPRLPLDLHERILRVLWKQNPAELYEGVSCPVLMLPASSADRAEKEKALALAQEKIADIETVWLEESIHEVPLQHPHRLAEEVRRFLAERV